jgi:hypothetical protein
VGNLYPSFRNKSKHTSCQSAGQIVAKTPAQTAKRALTLRGSHSLCRIYSGRSMSSRYAQKKEIHGAAASAAEGFDFRRNLYCLSANLGGNTAPCIGPSAYRLLTPPNLCGGSSSVPINSHLNQEPAASALGTGRQRCNFASRPSEMNTRRCAFPVTAQVLGQMRGAKSMPSPYRIRFLND